jgi:aminopeptidase-like protein
MRKFQSFLLKINKILNLNFFYSKPVDKENYLEILKNMENSLQSQKDLLPWCQVNSPLYIFVKNLTI